MVQLPGSGAFFCYRFSIALYIPRLVFFLEKLFGAYSTSGVNWFGAVAIVCTRQRFGLCLRHIRGEQSDPLATARITPRIVL